jgi:hypothetical protein
MRGQRMTAVLMERAAYSRGRARVRCCTMWSWCQVGGWVVQIVATLLSGVLVRGGCMGGWGAANSWEQQDYWTVSA